MGLWNNHRLRQAGKYQKAEYKLMRQMARQPRPVARVTVQVTARAIPPRPDQPALP